MIIKQRVRSPPTVQFLQCYNCCICRNENN